MSADILKKVGSLLTEPVLQREKQGNV